MTNKIERKVTITSRYSGKQVVLSENPKRCPFGKNRRKKYDCCVGCYDNLGGWEETGKEQINCGYIKRKRHEK